MTQNVFEKFHLLTEEQYEQETKSPNDIYAVAMPSITPGEIVVKGFQGDMPTTLTAAQQAAARAFFGTGVKIVSADPTVQQAEMVDAELLDVHIETITIDGTTYKVLCVN